MRVIGLLGGTFDPVHYGHLRVGYEIYQGLSLDEIRFIPCADPPHKATPGASSEQRVAMLRLAIKDEARFQIDERELRREGASYTIDTLISLRQELGEDVSLCWIVGSDSFQSLDTWHRWEALFEFAHIIVACRPGWQADHSSPMGKRLAERFIQDPLPLKQKNAGYILPHKVTQLAISATDIRNQVKKGESPRFLLPEGVLEMINSKQLYRQ